ncbi:MAG TPA: ferritin-like domain-containing protein [Saprospiraceae bacterium]|nr:ferritin-like domain-containing protein [Saprospiraceae bacterium]
MKNPANWDRTDLQQHLQRALNLELWTIPLYLTALYSIRGLDKKRHHEYPEAAKLIFSVVIQEMLHLELVCNLSNALGFQPKFYMPCYDEKIGIPFIHPEYGNLPRHLQEYSVQPQALNEDSLRLFCAIELPHPKREIHWEKQNTFHSIAELYEALQICITQLWPTCYVGNDQNTKQKNSFQEYHNQGGKNHGFSQCVDSVANAMKAIDAIVEQGEGANSQFVPVDFRPPVPEKGKEYDTAWHKGHLSHYQKFSILLNGVHDLPEVYKVHHGDTDSIEQMQLEDTFKEFLSGLEEYFNTEGSDMPMELNQKMNSLGPAIAAVWESGRCPEFKPS